MAAPAEQQDSMGGAVVSRDQEPVDASAATQTAEEGVPAPSAKEGDASAQGPASTEKAAVSSFQYTPQFAALEALILARIKAPSSSNGPDGGGSGVDGGHEAGTGPAPGAYEKGEDKEHTAPGRLAETLSMPTPSGQDTLTAAARIRAANSLRTLGRKRKRDVGSEDKDQDENQEGQQSRGEPVDFSQSTISFPPQVLKAPPPPPPPPLPPVLAQEDADMPDADAAAAAVDEDLERLRAGNLAALPRGIVPARPELVGFPAGPASDVALSTYFYGRKKTDLLNILSLADQLKPQLLVDILVSVTKRHPDLPIFPSPDWNPDAQHPDHRPALKIRLKHNNNNNHPSNSTSTSSTSNNNNSSSGGKSSLFLSHHRRLLHQRPRHGHVIAPESSKSRHKHKNPRVRVAKPPAAAAELDRDAEDADEDPAAEHEHADSLPPTWPRADQGLYARLTAEDQDRAFLLDENDEEAFSHFAVDKFGKQTALLVLPAAA